MFDLMSPKQQRSTAIMFVAVGVAGVLAYAWMGKKKLTGTGGGGSTVAPITIETALTPEGLPVPAFDKLWRYDSYPSTDQWAAAAIAELDAVLPPGSTLLIYRPSEEYRSATDALKKARDALRSGSSWILQLRDLESLTPFG